MRRLVFLGVIAILAPVAFADGADGIDVAQDALMDLSLEELLGVEVTSVSRRSESLSTAAAAIYVVSQQDIRRSGVTTIPDALRMVPGVNVAQIDGNKWAVTARGSNGRYAAKLLVLMDGRTIYSPLFSGVFWDVQDISLESIERIEVIRGPGATLWGANAVNGIINIITKSAADTPGGFVEAGFGSEGGNQASFRYGGELGAGTHYRAYAKYHDRMGHSDLSGNPTADDWQSARAGVRIDHTNAAGDSLMFITELYENTMGSTIYERSLQPPYLAVLDAEEEAMGYYAQLAWNRTLDNGSDMGLQIYYDHSQRDAYLYQELTVDTIDIDFQHSIRAGDRHELIWGLGYRINDDELISGFSMGLDPAERTQRWASAFVQDEIALRPDEIYLTIGAKFEHTNYSQEEVEFEPNIRLRWKAGETGSAWASISRAMRLPSRGDLDAAVVNAVLPPLVPPNAAPVPLAITLSGNPAYLSEELIAYEIGFRSNPNDNLIVDLAAYYHEYEDQRSIVPGIPVCMPSGVPTFVDPLCVLSAQYIENPLSIGNMDSYDSYGLEAVVDWTPADWWRLQGTFSSIRNANESVPLTPQFAFIQESPDYQVSVRSMMNLGENTELDSWFRYVDELPNAGIDSYLELDLRIGWSPTPELQFALVGQNLLEDAHQEFVSELSDVVPVQIERRAYIEARWSF